MKYISLFILFLVILSIDVSGQTDTVYYFDRYNSPCPKEFSLKRTTVKYFKKGKIELTDTITINILGKIKIEKYKIKQLSDSIYADRERHIKYHIQYNPDSALYLIKTYKNDILTLVGYSSNKFPQIYQGKVTEYYELNGKLHSIYYCENNKVTDIKWWKINGVRGVDSICPYPDIPATFNNNGVAGFRDYVTQHLVYPEQAGRNRISGKVLVQFVVMEDGSMRDIQIINDVNISLKYEVAYVMLSCNKKWKPAYYHGRKVRTIYTLPIIFVLE